MCGSEVSAHDGRGEAATDSVVERLSTRWAREVTAGAPTVRIALADGQDARVRTAANQLARMGVQTLLIGDPGDDLDPAVLVRPTGGRDPEAEDVLHIVAATRGWGAARREQCCGDPVYRAAALVRAGVADAAVAGATAPSSDVIRAGIQVIGLRAPGGLLSSCFLMQLPRGTVLAFGDCAVVPEPDDSDLADIAVSTARTFAELTGEDPAVALLSFSTAGSATHPAVERVRRATALVIERAPGLRVDGELQFDAAFVPKVATSKAPGSVLAGCANVFIFPDLAAGNIGYKIAQRIGGAAAYGPILQGLAAPLNDVSRGCDVDDVVNVALLSLLQARPAERPIAQQPAW